MLCTCMYAGSRRMPPPPSLSASLVQESSRVRGIYSPALNTSVNDRIKRILGILTFNPALLARQEKTL